jgi:DNA-directed RNA polymerase subunit RPC12/RpoP
MSTLHQEFFIRGSQQDTFTISTDKPFTCHHCAKRFLTANEIRRHLRFHIVEKSYACHHCTKSFSTSSDLGKHLCRYADEKPYTCQHCTKSFSLAGNLKTHLRSHTGEKPYACQHCTKSFSQASNLKTHLRRHTSEKPYACQHCTKSFSTAIELKTHGQSQCGENPYACQHGSGSFTNFQGLENDTQSHLDEKSFGFQHFSRSCSLVSHEQSNSMIRINNPSLREHCSSECGILAVHSSIDLKQEAVSTEVATNDNGENLCRSESYEKSSCDSTMMKRIHELDCDGDNVVCTDSGEVKTEPDETAVVTEFYDVYPCADEQRNVGSGFCGDYKPECDWKLLVEPFVRLDVLNITNVVKPHRCLKAESWVVY